MSLSLGSDEVWGVLIGTAKAKMSENFLSPKIGQILTFYGPGVQEYGKYRLLLRDAHHCLNPRRLSHFV